ncbi:unnamed protein product, partial [Oppiella nova]
MGSNCSSLRRNGKKDKKTKADEEDNDNDGQLNKIRKSSTDSLPYGKASTGASDPHSGGHESAPQPSDERGGQESSRQPTIKVDVPTEDHYPNPSPVPPVVLSPPPPNTSPTISESYSRPDSRSVSGNTSPDTTANRCYTQLIAIKDDDKYLIAISLHSNELT